MLIGGLIGRLDDATIANGIEIARAAGEIGGYGLIKDAAVERYHAQLQSLRHAFDKAAAPPSARAACSESNAPRVPRPRPFPARHDEPPPTRKANPAPRCRPTGQPPTSPPAPAPHTDTAPGATRRD